MTALLRDTALPDSPNQHADAYMAILARYGMLARPRQTFEDYKQAYIERFAGRSGPVVLRAEPFVAAKAVEAMAVAAARGLDPFVYGVVSTLVPQELLTYTVADRRTLEFQFNVAHSILSWKARGSKVYETSRNLTQRLLYTELRGIRGDDLKLPYASIFIRVPPHPSLRVYNGDTGWHDILGVYVSAESKFRDRDAGGWSLMVVGKSKNPDSVLDDALFMFSIILRDGKLADPPELVGPMRAEENDANWQTFFRWVMNAVLYATWPDAEVDHVIPNAEARALWERIERLDPKTQRNKRDKLKQRLKTLDTRRVILLGRNVAKFERADAGTGDKLMVRSHVSGHWRRYHVGEGRATTVRKWIQPFWRGPEGALAIEPVHRMTTRDEAT